MAKGPVISNEIKQAVASIHREHPDWIVKEIQKEIDKFTNGRAPGLSSIQKILAQIKRNEEEERFLKQDRTWSLGTLNEYPMPAEVIPILLKIQNMFSGREYKLNIRRARWVSRLFTQFKDKIHLLMVAAAYAEYEARCELNNIPCDTSNLDCLLLENDGATKVFKEVMSQVIGDDYVEQINRLYGDEKIVFKISQQQ